MPMTFLRANGAELDVDENGQGNELLLLHSLLTDRRSFALVVPELAKKRRVLAPALPGFGGSTPAGPGIENHADRLAAFLPALSLRAKPDVVANGFGGVIALALAARHGDRIGRLVLCDTAACFPESGRAQFRAMAEAVEKHGMSAVVDTAVRRIFTPAWIARHPEVVGERMAVLSRTDPTQFAAACRALATVDLRPVLPDINNPTLVVVGSLDTATPIELARELADGIAGATLREIPDCGHCPPLQEPEKFLAAIRDFLELPG
jgi:pimeloyl-ACP methyl ester carboxylesterase